VTTAVSELRMVEVDRIRPCPFQPRVNVSIHLVRKLARSMSAGRHEPLLEVESLPDEPDSYQIICGEQRWRAAREAGLRGVLVRVHPPMGYLDRLRKQYEENQVRADLDPIEEAHSVRLFKVMADSLAAEQLLAGAGIAFRRLEDLKVGARGDFFDHLDYLKGLLAENHTHQTASGSEVRPLSPWRETESALGISESARKAKMAILRVPHEVQESVRALPAEHAVQISRLRSGPAQTELAARAGAMTHREVRSAVEHLLQAPLVTASDAATGATDQVSEEGGVLSFEAQLTRTVDLCRQLARLLRNLSARVTPDQRHIVVEVLDALHEVAEPYRVVAE
jgi:hypothetical protein